MQGIFRGLKQLALIAMIARALLPAGWMPSHNPAAPFVICTMNGPLHQAPDKGNRNVPASDHHGICPFAAAPHFAATPVLPHISLPGIHTQIAEVGRSNAATVSVRFTPGSARAPPLNA